MEKETVIEFSEYGKNPGFKKDPKSYHRVSPAVDLEDDWVLPWGRDGQQGSEIEVREGREPEGEVRESVFSIGNAENGTAHVVVKRNVSADS